MKRRKHHPRLVHGKQCHLMCYRVRKMEHGLRPAHSIGKRASTWDYHYWNPRPSRNVQDGWQPSTLGEAPAKFYHNRLCRPGSSF